MSAGDGSGGAFSPCPPPPSHLPLPLPPLLPLQSHTAARVAVDYDHDTCLTLIMQYGGSATSADAVSHTPLYSAMRHCNAKAVEVLLRHGGDVMEEYRDGSTPLHVAAASGFAAGVTLVLAATEMVQFLLDKTNRRGDVAFMAGCRSGRGGDALRALQDAGSSMPHTALHVAAAAPKKAALEYLIGLGNLDINAKDPAVRVWCGVCGLGVGCDGCGDVEHVH